MKALAGLALALAHAAAFVALVPRCDGTELEVEVRGPDASPVLALDGVVPPALADRVTITDEAVVGPGLARRRWGVRYRGGFERSVGATQLVGPFQDPAARTCTGRVVVGQRLLDDGHAGPGTVAHELARAITDELTGESVVGAGDFVRVSKIAVRWAQPMYHPWDQAFVGAAPHGYVHAQLTIELERVAIPVDIALVPAAATAAPQAPSLGFRVASRAELAFDNRIAQWLSDKLGGDWLATKIARGQIEGVLVSALAPPPPLELGDGQVLRFGYCDEPPEIVEGISGALPFAVELGRVPGAPSILPVRRGRAPRLPIARDAALAIDLDLDALDAVLYELWRGGFLDRELTRAALHDRFNSDPVVQELLSIRILPVRLALPPVLAPSPRGLRLAAEGRVTITDAGASTVGRVWGALDFAFGNAVEAVGVDLGALELSCERTPTTLVPCYADLVDAMQGRAPELHGSLTQAFTNILSEIFVERRLVGPGMPAELVIRRAVPRLAAAGKNASLHLDLDAALHSTREPR